VGKQSKPTAEELRFVYDLIAKGYSDLDIVAEYTRLYENSQLMFPLRGDKRFFKDRRRELDAASEVLQEHIKRKVDPIISRYRKEHFDHLADIANLLLAGDLDKILVDTVRGSSSRSDEYQILVNGSLETISQHELVMRLEGNMEAVFVKYGFWDFGCFESHFKAEYSHCQNLAGLLESNPIELIEALRPLAQRKTFKGTCPVCKDWQ